MIFFKGDKDKLDIIVIVMLFLYLFSRNFERIFNIDCRIIVLKYSFCSIYSKGVECGVVV